jgi:hypothetical protein
MKKLIVCLFTILIVFACKKDKEEQYVQAANDHTLAQTQSLGVISQIHQIFREYEQTQTYAPDTFIKITSTPGFLSDSFPKTVEINYGIGNNIGLDGKKRNGKIQLVFENNQYLLGNHSYSLINYSVNETNIIGNVEVSQGLQGITYTMDEGIRVVNPNGTILWKGNFTLKPESSDYNTDITNASFEFICSNTGQDRTGKSFTSSVSQSQVQNISMSCNSFILSGSATVTPLNLNSQTINYGSGTCSSSATISFQDGSTKGISLN